MPKKKDYYAILEVKKDATTDDVKKSYHRLALTYHPDKNPLGEEKFKAIVEAYEILGDPAKREKYDAEPDKDDLDIAWEELQELEKNIAKIDKELQGEEYTQLGHRIHSKGIELLKKIATEIKVDLIVVENAHRVLDVLMELRAINFLNKDNFNIVINCCYSLGIFPGVFLFVLSKIDAINKKDFLNIIFSFETAEKGTGVQTNILLAAWVDYLSKDTGLSLEKGFRLLIKHPKVVNDKTAAEEIDYFILVLHTYFTTARSPAPGLPAVVPGFPPAEAILDIFFDRMARIASDYYLDLFNLPAPETKDEIPEEPTVKEQMLQLATSRSEIRTYLRHKADNPARLDEMQCVTYLWEEIREWYLQKGIPRKEFDEKSCDPNFRRERYCEYIDRGWGWKLAALLLKERGSEVIVLQKQGIGKEDKVIQDRDKISQYNAEYSVSFKGFYRLTTSADNFTDFTIKYDKPHDNKTLEKKKKDDASVLPDQKIEGLINKVREQFEVNIILKERDYEIIRNHLDPTILFYDVHYQILGEYLKVIDEEEKADEYNLIEKICHLSLDAIRCLIVLHNLIAEDNGYAAARREGYIFRDFLDAKRILKKIFEHPDSPENSKWIPLIILKQQLDAYFKKHGVRVIKTGTNTFKWVRDQNANTDKNGKSWPAFVGTSGENVIALMACCYRNYGYFIALLAAGLDIGFLYGKKHNPEIQTRGVIRVVTTGDGKAFIDTQDGVCGYQIATNHPAVEEDYQNLSRFITDHPRSFLISEAARKQATSEEMLKFFAQQKFLPGVHEFYPGKNGWIYIETNPLESARRGRITDKELLLAPLERDKLTITKVKRSLYQFLMTAPHKYIHRLLFGKLVLEQSKALEARDSLPSAAAAVSVVRSNSPVYLGSAAAQAAAAPVEAAAASMVGTPPRAAL